MLSEPKYQKVEGDGVLNDCFVLVDTSAQHLEAEESITDYLKRLKSTKDLETKELEKQVITSRTYLDIVSRDNIFSLEVLIEEQRKFFISLSDTIKELVRKSMTPQEMKEYLHLIRNKRSEGEKYLAKQTKARFDSEKFGKIDEIKRIRTDALKISKGKIYVPKNRERSERTIEIVKILDEEEKIKRRHHVPTYGVRKDSHADEAMVGTILYRAIHENEPSTVLTSDHDIGRLSRRAIKWFIEEETPTEVSGLEGIKIVYARGGNIHFYLPFQDVMSNEK